MDLEGGRSRNIRRREIGYSRHNAAVKRQEGDHTDAARWRGRTGSGDQRGECARTWARGDARRRAHRTARCRRQMSRACGAGGAPTLKIYEK